MWKRTNSSKRWLGVRRFCCVVALVAGSLGCAGGFGGGVDVPSDLADLIGDDDGARAAYRQALEHKKLPDATGPDEPDKDLPSFSKLLSRGDRLRDSGNSDDAFWAYLAALRKDPQSPLPLERVGFMELWDDPEQAERIFEELAASHPGLVVANQGLGMAQLALAKPEAARRSFARALEIDPKSADAMAGLGLAYYGVGEHEKARASYFAALEIEPRNADTLNNLGLSYLNSKAYEAAAEAFGSALRLRPDRAEFRNNLGMAYGRLQEYEESCAEFLRGGTRAAAENNQGYVYFLNGRYDQAIGHYERALTMGGEHKLTVVRNLIDAQDARDAIALGDWPEGDPEVR